MYYESNCILFILFFFLVVEDLFRGREPLDLDAVYFLTPTKSSVAALLCDFPLIEKTKYKSAHIYFTHGKHFEIVLYLHCLYFQF